MFFKNKFIIIFLFYFFTTNVHSIELIRDVELEEFTKEIMLPLTRSSNLEDNRIDLYFINSNEVNAFVTAGQRIFINTELIIQSKTYAEYLGVIAHELAHINAGHISRTKNQITELTEKIREYMKRQLDKEDEKIQELEELVNVFRQQYFMKESINKKCTQEKQKQISSKTPFK